MFHPHSPTVVIPTRDYGGTVRSTTVQNLGLPCGGLTHQADTRCPYNYRPDFSA